MEEKLWFILFQTFLRFYKKELLEYALINKMEWIEDESNLDIKFSRNFIRNSVFPLLVKYWPGFGKSLQFLSKEASYSHLQVDEGYRN